MTISAAQADAFYVEVMAEGTVWAIRDEKGFPAPLNADGNRSMPFWSKRSRAHNPIDLNSWITRWLPGLEDDSLLVGLNWNGHRASGYDVEPCDVLSNLESRGMQGQ